MVMNYGLPLWGTKIIYLWKLDKYVFALNGTLAKGLDYGVGDIIIWWLWFLKRGNYRVWGG